MKNRIIKFRAFDKTINQMFFPTMINKHGDVRHNGVATSLQSTRFYSYGQEFETWLLNDTNSFELMQFTGLLDMNNKEIYEGDIINIVGNKHTVKYENCSFDAFPQKAYANTLSRFCTECIIIGNIFEGIQ